jgi:molybdate transport system ATP-binding protein
VAEGDTAGLTDVQLSRPLGPFDLDVAIETSARRIGITGPSGSGKSTLLRLLAGVDGRGVGLARLGGHVLQDTSAGIFEPAWERRTGWLPQDSAVFPHLTVQRNLEYAAHPGADVAAITRDLEIEGLLHRTSMRLSGGEAQRVALGRALLSCPERFLLDEPFSALDEALKERVVRMLDKRLGERPTFIVSHDLSLLESLGAEVWMMERGQARRL